MSKPNKLPHLQHQKALGGFADFYSNEVVVLGTIVSLQHNRRSDGVLVVTGLLAVHETFMDEQLRQYAKQQRVRIFARDTLARVLIEAGKGRHVLIEGGIWTLGIDANPTSCVAATNIIVCDGVSQHTCKATLVGFSRSKYVTSPTPGEYRLTLAYAQSDMSEAARDIQWSDGGFRVLVKQTPKTEDIFKDWCVTSEPMGRRRFFVKGILQFVWFKSTSGIYSACPVLRATAICPVPRSPGRKTDPFLEHQRNIRRISS